MMYCKPHGSIFKGCGLLNRPAESTEHSPALIWAVSARGRIVYITEVISTVFCSQDVVKARRGIGPLPEADWSQSGAKRCPAVRRSYEHMRKRNFEQDQEAGKSKSQSHCDSIADDQGHGISDQELY